MVDEAAPWGFRFKLAPMSVVRRADAAWRSTIRAIAADPAGAAAEKQPVCILVDGVLAEVDGWPPVSSTTPTALPPDSAWRVLLPWANRQRP